MIVFIVYTKIRKKGFLLKDAGYSCCHQKDQPYITITLASIPFLKYIQILTQRSCNFQSFLSQHHNTVPRHIFVLPYCNHCGFCKVPYFCKIYASTSSLTFGKVGPCCTHSIHIGPELLKLLSNLFGYKFILTCEQVKFLSLHPSLSVHDFGGFGAFIHLPLKLDF